jgi:hypothetical protein
MKPDSRPMSERYFNGKAALLDLIQGIAFGVSRRLEENGFNASGRLSRSVSTSVADEVVPTATLFALDHWRYAGNGRGPGKMPPKDKLAQWALDKGIAKDEAEANSIGFLVARAIAREGSLDYQLGGKNQFEEEIKEQQPRVGAVLREFLRDEHRSTVSQFNRAFKAA